MDIDEFLYQNFRISKLFIQCSTGNCCVHITGGVKIYLCVCKPIGLYVLCAFVSV